MKLHHCFFYYLFFYTNITYSSEYIYPVACLDNGITVLYIHQSNATSLELLEWNSKTDHTEQVLWSLFNPAGFQLLPDNSGFSFIDNGRLRIKLFERRSPRTIDFDEPLFNFNSLHWLDRHTCYCSAQQGDNFGLFQLYDNGMVECLLKKDDVDYMYPQKIDDQLFYIERYSTKKDPRSFHYQIVCSLYSRNNSCANKQDVVVDFADTPIIFLTMISNKEGFVLEHIQNIDPHNQTIQFLYHQIKQKNAKWHSKMLFSFDIPTNLLFSSDERLYESLLPLLPRIVNNKIYFVDSAKTDDNNLRPYFYDLSKNLTQNIIVPIKHKGHYFVPMLCGKKFCCGGTMVNREKHLLFFN